MNNNIQCKDMPKGVNKRIWLEWLRVFACFWVIYNHTHGFSIFEEVPICSLKYFLYLIVSLICRTAVPLFFMISGALLIGRDKDLKKTIKRINKTLLQIILINLLYVVYRYFRYDDSKSLYEIFKYLYTGSGLSAHLWYMYAYLGYLVILPFLSIIGKHINGKLIIYVLCVIFTYRIVEMIQYFVLHNKIRLSSYLEPTWFLDNGFCAPLLGFYFGSVLDRIEKKHIVIAIVLGVVALVLPIIENVIFVSRNGGTYEGINSQTFHNKFAIYLALSLYIIARKIFDRQNNDNKQSRSVSVIRKMEEKSIVWLGQTTFGVYIIHIMIKDLPIMKQYLSFLMSLKINDMIANLVFVFCVFILSAFIIFIWQQLKKRIISLCNYLFA